MYLKLSFVKPSFEASFNVGMIEGIYFLVATDFTLEMSTLNTDIDISW